MTPEIHLFIIWEKAGTASNDVLNRIGREFEILRVFRIRWSPRHFSRNLARFYGQKLPAGCAKEESCGTGPFTLIVVRDHRPDYATRETTRGLASVNVRTFDLKTHFRSPPGGALPVHATDSPREAAHDLMLLLGLPTGDFPAAYPDIWDGREIFLRRDLAGACGWRSAEELFLVLNETVEYVVLRNFESLPEHCHSDAHGDIDLLVSNYMDACLVANAAPAFHDPRRVHHTVIIDGSAMPFDFRHVGDGYFDEAWQKRMLESRIFMEKGFYVPDAENHFYSLLYHAAVHKTAIAEDYTRRLSDMAEHLGIRIDAPRLFQEPSQIRQLLLGYMRTRGYRFTRPHDPSVHYNTMVACSPMERMVGRFLSRIAPERKIPVEDPLPPPQPAGTQHGAYRAHLMRPLRLHAGQRVLELGCEDGAITRQIGETGAEVIAVESVPLLAAQAEKRCRDLSNVEVVLDDPASAEIEGRFDVVTLIGTPARLTTPGDAFDPLEFWLDRASSFLDERGLLILAMDNQLGLKSFNGSPDEGTGIPFHGINDLRGRGRPFTMGHHVLAQALSKAGFAGFEFFFPFPDYRNPRLILSEKALHDARINIADLLIHNTDRPWPDNGHRVFAENLAWRAVLRNRMLPGLANSFLVCARKVPQDGGNIHWLASLHGHPARRACYQVETTIETAGNGCLVVHRRKLFPAHPEPESAWLAQVISDENYHRGNLVLAQIHEAMARESDIDGLSASFAPWFDFLSTHVIHGQDGLQSLPGNFIDCVPANLLESPTGELHYIDAEWVSPDPVPLAWTVIRGLFNSLAGCLENRHLAHMTYRQLITEIALRNGMLMQQRDFLLAASLEQRLADQCLEPDPGRKSLVHALDEPLQGWLRLSAHIPDLRRKLAAQEYELARVKSTVSWQITKPLRFLAFLWRKITGQH